MPKPIPKIQVIKGRICITCNRDPWDCKCPRSFKCTHCEMDTEDAEFVWPWGACEDSPDREHNWVDTTPEG